MKSIVYLAIVLALLCLVQNCKAQSSETETEFLTSTQIWLHNLPRTAFDGSTVNASMFSSTETEYQESMGVIGVVLISPGVFAVLLIAIFLIGRCCCNSFGGKAAELDYEDYRVQRIIVTVWIVFIALCMLACIGVGIWGCVWLASPGASHFKELIREKAQEQSDLMKQDMATINNWEPTTLSQGFYTTFKDAADEVVTQSDDSSYTVDNVGESLRLFGWTTLYFSALVVTLLLVGAAFFSCERVSYCVGICSFFLIFLAWASVACHIIINIGMADLCSDIEIVGLENRLQERLDRFTANGNMSSPTAIESVFFCVDIEQANAAINWTQNIIAQQPNSTAALTTVISHLRSFQKCDWISLVLTPLDEQVCDKQIAGSTVVWASSFGIAILLFPLGIFGILGSKRFKRKSYGLFDDN